MLINRRLNTLLIIALVILSREVRSNCISVLNIGYVTRMQMTK